MNVHDEMSDSEVLRAAADVLSAIPVAEPPDAEAVMARGRARRRYRRATLGLASTTAAAAVAISLAAALGGSPASPPRVGTIQTTAFTLVKNADGTVTLTLTQGQMFDPSVLQRALARDGVPALVKIGTFCGSSPAVPWADARAVWSVRLPDGTRVPQFTPDHQQVIPRDAVEVINPAAIPAGTELFFDFVNRDRTLIGDPLIYTNSYSCFNGSPPGTP
jgi:hypothetical protein